MRQVLKLAVLDIWENAVVVGILNALWLSVAFGGAVAAVVVSAYAPAIAILLSGVLAAALLAALAPFGALLIRLARRAPLKRQELADAYGKGILVALGGIGAVSGLVLGYLATGTLPAPMTVALAVLCAWLCLLVAQLTLFAIASLDAARGDFHAALQGAVDLAFQKPLTALAAVIIVVVAFASVVILLPGPAGAALFLRRLAETLSGPLSDEELTDGELGREIASRHRAGLKGLLFPWKA